MASPAITNIVPLGIEYTDKGILVRAEVTYKGGTKAIVTIRTRNIIEVARLSRPISDLITKRGFAKGA